MTTAIGSARRKKYERIAQCFCFNEMLHNRNTTQSKTA